MKKLNWVLQTADGKDITWGPTRDAMRESKKWYEENIFEFDWIVKEYAFPLKIIREEWELVDKRVVR